MIATHRTGRTVTPSAGNFIVGGETFAAETTPEEDDVAGIATGSVVFEGTVDTVRAALANLQISLVPETCNMTGGFQPTLRCRRPKA